MRRLLYLAIEGGGSTTRVALADAADQVLFLRIGGPASPLYVSPRRFAANLRPMIRAAVAAVAKEPNTRIATVGLSGPMDLQAARSAVCAFLAKTPIIAYSEGETVLAAAGLRHGVALTAGTGASARATDESGAWAEVGGFGPQFDDLGSGYWIAREGIAACMRAAHGRGPETALTQAIKATFKTDDLWSLVPRERNGHADVFTIARFAPAVTTAAAQGDPVARKIVAEAARHLATLVIAATRRVHFSDALIPVAPAGGVFRSGAVILAPLRRALGQADKRFRIVPPVCDPVRGLLVLLSQQQAAKGAPRHGKLEP